VPVDDAATQAALTALIGQINVASEQIAVKSALIVQRIGMGLTHVRTGTLRRSWHTEPLGGEGGTYSARVGPTTVYARRQELGFSGPDSLGRVYKNDPGWPYVRPAREQAQLPIQAMAGEVMRAAIGA
jgi:hypothetical protein